MKILKIIGDLRIGGAERIAVDLAKGLKNKGHQVMVCSLTKGGPLEKELRQEGVETIVLSNLPLRGKYTFYFVFRLWRLMRKQKFDIVHTHVFMSNFWGRIAGCLSGVKVIISTEHNQDLWKKRRHIFADKILSLCTHKIIAVSGAVESFVVKKEKINAKRLTLIHNAVDTKKFMPCDVSSLKKELNIPAGAVIIGTVSRLIPQKGQRYFLQAARVISKNNQNVRFLIIGDGQLKNDLRALSERLMLSDKVIFTGFRPDIIGLLTLLDIFVLPSLWEGFGLALLEAMALAKPVVATDVGGIPEIIENGKTGILVKPKDPEALARAILKLINDNLYARGLGLNARKTVQERFSLNTMIDKVEAVYRSFLN